MKNVAKTIVLLSLLMLMGAGSIYATEIPTVKSGNIQYRTHVENYGWQDWKDEGVQSGTTGQGFRLEGIEIETINMPDADVGVRYQTHVENIGWQDWVDDGTTSGTVAKGLRLEAIRIELTGADADQYDVYYQVHAQNFGWLGWAKNGESAGTAGYGYRLESIQILLKAKGETSPVEEGKAAFKEYVPDGNWSGQFNIPEADSTGATGKPIFGDE